MILNPALGVAKTAIKWGVPVHIKTLKNTLRDTKCISNSLTKMFKFVVLSACLAFAAAAPQGILATSWATAPLSLAAPSLPATLLPRVAVAPAVTTVVKQPLVVQEAQPILRSVPVPIKAISYAAPSIALTAPLATPLATPLAAHAIATPFAAPLATSTLLLK